MRWLILSIILISVLTGCSENTKIKTPPWTDKDIELMGQNEVNCVPVLKIDF